MKGKNKLDTTDKLPHASDIREFTNRSLHERDDYKSAMSKIRAAIQAQAAKGKSEVVVGFYDTDGTIPRAVVQELSAAGYRTSLNERGETFDGRWFLDIWW